MPSVFRGDELPKPIRVPETRALSLAELSATGTAISWDEAVAIAQQTTSVLLDHQGTPIVDLATVCLQESGELVLRLSGSADPESSVRSVGELLRTLLAGTRSPQPLDVVIGNATSTPPTFSSVAELSHALSRYERPNRRELIRRVYRRWQTHAATTGHSPFVDPAATTQPRPPVTTSWIARLKGASGFRESVQPGPSTAYLRKLERRRRLTRNIYLGASVTVLAVAILGSDLSIAAALRGTLSTVVDATAIRAWRARPTLASVVNSGAGWVQAPFSRTVRVPNSSAVSPDSATTVPNAFTPVRAASGANRQARMGATPNRSGNATSPVIGAQVSASIVAAQQNTVGPSPQPTADSPLQTALSVDLTLPPSTVPSSSTSQGSAAATQGESTAAPAAQRAFDAVYTATNTEIAPPVPLDVQLFDSPPAGPQRFVAFDIVVDANGRVETAKLVVQPNDMREAMQATGNLSAAKTWRFRPATKDGQAVKYRARVWLLVRD
jgi:hypothetical protein